MTLCKHPDVRLAFDYRILLVLAIPRAVGVGIMLVKLVVSAIGIGSRNCCSTGRVAEHVIVGNAKSCILSVMQKRTCRNYLLCRDPMSMSLEEFFNARKQDCGER